MITTQGQLDLTALKSHQQAALSPRNDATIGTTMVIISELDAGKFYSIRVSHEFKRSKPMIARILAILVMLVALAPLNVPPAQASVKPVFVVDSFFTALNDGNHEAAVA